MKNRGFIILIVILFIAVVLMASARIKDLDDIGANLADADEFVLYDASSTTDMKIDWEDIITEVFSDFGITSSAAEINKLDGTDAIVTDFNKLHDITSTAAELNKLDGTDATVTDFNKLHDVTATYTELNITDAGSSEAIYDGGSGVYFRAGSAAQIKILDGSIEPSVDDDVDLGASGTQFKNGYFDGIVTVDLLAIHVGSAAAPSFYREGDVDTGIYFPDVNQMAISNGGTGQVIFKDGVVEPVTDDDVDLGSSSKEFQDGYFDGTIYADDIDLGGEEILDVTSGVGRSNTAVEVGGTTYTATAGGFYSVTTTSAGNFCLPANAAGRCYIVHILLVSDAGDLTIVDNASDAGFAKSDGTSGGTTITLDNEGEFVILMGSGYATGKWAIIGGYGYTAAG